MNDSLRNAFCCTVAQFLPGFVMNWWNSWWISDAERWNYFEKISDKPCVVAHGGSAALYRIHILPPSNIWTDMLLSSAALAGQPRGVFLQDTTPRWHMCLITLAQWWCRRSRREREAGREGCFSSARASRAVPSPGAQPMEEAAVLLLLRLPP